MVNIYLFLEKNEIRKMKLLYYIREMRSNTYQIQELNDVNGTSRKTTQKDMKELGKDILEIYSVSGTGENDLQSIIVALKNIISLNQLFIHYLKNSRFFLVLHTKMTHPTISFSEMKDILFYSSSIIYKTCEKINEMLRPISLSISNEDFKGNENIIRYFYFEMYWSFFGGVEWPFEYRKTDLVIELEKCRKKLDYLGKEKSLYWLAVQKLRIDGGHLINNEKFEGGRHCFLYKEELYMNRILDFFSVKEPIHYNLLKDSFISKNNNELEIFFVKYLKEIEPEFDIYLQMHLKFKKVNYCIEEKLLECYHFFELESLSYFKKNYCFFENSFKVYIDRFDVLIVSAYIFELKKIGCVFFEPLRIQFNSKDGNVEDIIKKFRNQSFYPIRPIYNNMEFKDCIVTNVLSEYYSNEKKNHYFFCEYPFSDDCIKDIVNKALNLKKRDETYSNRCMKKV